VWDVSIIDSVMKDFYNKDMDTMVDALQMNLTLSAPVNHHATFSCSLIIIQF
jgi:histone deacetylase complex regulatory component SIN3